MVKINQWNFFLFLIFMNLFFQVLCLQIFIFFLPYILHHHIISLRPNYLSVYGVSELLKFFLFLLLYLQIPLRSEVDWLPGLWLLLLYIVFDLPRIVNVLPISVRSNLSIKQSVLLTNVLCSKFCSNTFFLYFIVYFSPRFLHILFILLFRFFIYIPV